MTACLRALALFLVAVAWMLPAPATAQVQWAYAGPAIGHVDHWWPSPHHEHLAFVCGDLTGHPTGEPSTLVTFDGGGSFILDPAVRDAEWVGFPTFEDLVYAITPDEVLRSEDGGQTWSQVGQAPGEIGEIAVTTDGPQNIFYNLTDLQTDGSYRRIERATSDGFSWTTVYDGDPYPIRDSFTDLLIDPYNDMHLFAVRPTPTQPGINGLYESSDGGETWEFVNGSIPPGDDDHLVGNLQYWLTPGALLVDRIIDGERVVSASQDGGHNWSDLPGSRARVMSDQSVRLANDEGLWLQEAPGEGWQLVSALDNYPPAVHSDVQPHEVRFHPADPSQVYVFSQKDVWRRVDGFNDYWELGVDGFTSAQVRSMVVQPEILIPVVAICGERGIYIGDPAGLSWTRSLDGFFEGLIGHPYQNDRLLAWGPGGVWFTDDRGETWQQPPVGMSIFSASYSAAGDGPIYLHGSVGDQGVGLYRANADFSVIEPAVHDVALSSRLVADPVVPGQVFAWSLTAIHRSTDDGLTYSLLNDEHYVYDLELATENDSFALIRSNQWSHAYTSTDRAATFDGQLDYPAAVEDVHVGHGMIVVSDWYQPWVAEGGGDWFDARGNLPDEIYISDLGTDPMRFVFVATERAGLYMTGAWADLDVEDRKAPTATRFELLPVYPNPFNGQATVTVTLDRPGALDLQVLNLLGRRVLRLTTPGTGLVSAGTHQFSVDGTGLASGVYLVRARVPGHSTQTQRVTLVK